MRYKNLTDMKKGFTLVELIATVIVLSVLIAVAVPRFTFVLEKARAGEGMHLLEVLRQAQEVYKQETGGFTNDITQLDVTIPDPKYFDPPTVGIPLTAPLATIVRDTAIAANGYTLTIVQDGTIQCSSPAAMCIRLGCTGGVGNDECN